MNDSTRSSYDAELEDLEARALGGLDLVGRALVRTLEALENQDLELAQSVTADDDQIDERYLEIHRGLITLLATQSPVAGRAEPTSSWRKTPDNLPREARQPRSW